MREHGIRGKKPQQRLSRTTDSRHERPVAANVHHHGFAAAAVDRKWVADIIYVAIDEGWRYLAVVLDLFSRRVVGWSVADRLKRELVEEALQSALGRQRPPPGRGLIHHRCFRDGEEV